MERIQNITIVPARNRYGVEAAVEHVLTELGRGMSEEELLRGHPRLSREHIRAAMLYAAAILGAQEVIT